jgi:hypothetical protein
VTFESVAAGRVGFFLQRTRRARLVPGIHVLGEIQQEDVDGGVRGAEAMPSFRRLCPAMIEARE